MMVVWPNVPPPALAISSASSTVSLLAGAPRGEIHVHDLVPVGVVDPAGDVFDQDPGHDLSIHLVLHAAPSHLLARLRVFLWGM